jgi:hypothetical protein
MFVRCSGRAGRMPDTCEAFFDQPRRREANGADGESTLTSDATFCRTFFFVRIPAACCFVCSASLSWHGGGDSAQTHTRTESKVPALPAPPMPPNVTTSQMFCNVTVCPAIDQALGV